MQQVSQHFKVSKIFWINNPCVNWEIRFLRSTKSLPGISRRNGHFCPTCRFNKRRNQQTKNVTQQLHSKIQTEKWITHYPQLSKSWISINHLTKQYLILMYNKLAVNFIVSTHVFNLVRIWWISGLDFFIITTLSYVSKNIINYKLSITSGILRLRLWQLWQDNMTRYIRVDYILLLTFI